MAKRRNLKKEKAQRNQAYARQFRGRTTRNSRGGSPFSKDRGRGFKQNQDKDDSAEASDNFSSYSRREG